MDDEQVREAVRRALGGDDATADKALRVTLVTLGERIGRDEARHIATALGPSLGGWVFARGTPEPFDVDEFVRRVADREGVNLATAERHASAVFTALRQALPEAEFAHLRGRLPKDFGSLLGEVPVVVVPTDDDILAAVADRLGSDTGSAARVTDAVLCTLAERIAPGDVDHLIGRLPVRLHRPLREGRAQASERTRTMTLDRFLNRVAARSGIAPEDAERATEAVLAVLRDVAGPQEMIDIDVQLPDEYHHLLVHA